MQELSEIWKLVNTGGVIFLLLVAIIALWKGWVVRASEYHDVVMENRELEVQNKKLIADNAALQRTLESVVQGIAHPVRQTLEAIPTPEAVS